jgi:hypothetical protein
MKTVIIKSLKSNPQKRIIFIRILTEYNNKLGLRRAKDKLDALILPNKSIEFELEESRLDAFTEELIKLNLEYEIK